jgi:ribosomal protein L37AE/L43A
MSPTDWVKWGVATEFAPPGPGGSSKRTLYCVYCEMDTAHDWLEPVGWWQCSECKHLRRPHGLYCPQCKQGTLHFQYYDVWRCKVCGHAKKEGDGD